MSIQSEIDRIEQNVANTYAALSDLGADMPTPKNSDNLAQTVGDVKAVLYIEQTLSDEQKAQARQNVGAVSQTELNAVTDEIPTKNSDLTNDSGYITKAVSDLENYYTKSQTLTTEQINALVSTIPKFSIEVVPALPSSNISATTVYLVAGGESGNLYTEYIYVDGAWEMLGTQTVDLTGYATEVFVQDYAQPKGNYALKSEIPAVPSWAMQPNKPSYTANEVGADPTGTAAGAVSAHNQSEGAHPYIRQMIERVSGDIANLSAYATPQMYGAKGDGSADDSAAIQAAINAADYVIVPDGTYLIQNTIVIPADKKLQIEGQLQIKCPVGIRIAGNHISIVGNGTIYLPPDNASGTAIRFVVGDPGFIGYVDIDGVHIVGSLASASLYTNSQIGVEFIGCETQAGCCFININCPIISVYYGVYTHEVNGQNADSWITQVNINTTIENCVRAITYDWMGDASRIRGEIQPKISSSLGSKIIDVPVVNLPPYAYIDAMIWDVDSAVNTHALAIEKKNCTVWTVLPESYMRIADSARSTLALRWPTADLFKTTGGVLSGDLSFQGREIGLLLEKPDGTKERIYATSTGLVLAGADYTNWLPIATDTDRTTIFNGIGYKNDARLSGSSGAVVDEPGMSASGFIPVAPGDTVRIYNVPIYAAQNCYIIAYDSNNVVTGYTKWNGPGPHVVASEKLGGGLYNLTIDMSNAVFGTGFDAIRFSAAALSGDTIVTINETTDSEFTIVKSVNGKSGAVNLTAADVGARPSGWTPTAADVGAVPTSRKVNGKALSADITLSASDVGAVPTTSTLTVTGVDAAGVTHTWTMYGVSV